MAMLDLVDTLQVLWRLWLCLIIWDFGRLVLKTDSDAYCSGTVLLGSYIGMSKTWMLDTVDAFFLSSYSDVKALGDGVWQ